MTFPVLRGIDERQSPAHRSRDDEALCPAEQSASQQENRDGAKWRRCEPERQQIQHSGSRGREQADDHAALRSAAVGIVARPRARNQRSRELAACDEADHERTETQSIVHMDREYGHRDADDEEGYEHHAHDRQQCRREAGARLRFFHYSCRHASELLPGRPVQNLH